MPPAPSPGQERPLLVGSMAFFLFAIATFAQAVATAFVSAHSGPRGLAAGGLYLGAYFSGGLVGTAVVGAAYGLAGWPAAVATVALSLLGAAWAGCGLAGVSAAPGRLVGRW